MRPPGYRRMDEYGSPRLSCLECVHQKELDLRLLCLKHLAYVGLFSICDDFDGGKKVGEYFVHDESLPPSLAEELRRSKLTEAVGTEGEARVKSDHP